MRPFVLFALIAGAVCGVAAEPANHAPRPRLDIPRAINIPLVTAAADDPAWKTAALIPNLQPAYNLEPQPGTYPATAVRALWTPEALFLRFTATDPELFTPLAKRDEDLYSGDVAEFFIDPVGDGRVLYEIGAAPNGSVYDTVTLVTATPVLNEALALDWGFYGREVWHDRAWNLEGLRCGAAKTAAGWTIDLILPAKGLLRRLGTDTFTTNQELRCNVLRYEWQLGADGKRSHLPLDWSPTAAGRPHISAAALGTFHLLP